jgi:protein-L-isoaspartate(D-aspartate) O-methyltransferase
MATPGPEELAAQRANMVRDQLEARGIRDELVLRAVGKVPREAFVPAFLQREAYADNPLVIGYEQTISQPYMVGLMTEALRLKGGERVLEIGTGSGYQTAVLAEICQTVYTIERLEPLSQRAQRVLHDLGYRNICYQVGDGGLGWWENAPFDGILVAAGAEHLPTAYHAQLREGGSLVIPLGPSGDQYLHRLTRAGDGYMNEDLGRVSFVPLVTSA